MKRQMGIGLLLLLWGCASNPIDREYDRYIHYKKELQESVTRGQLTQVAAHDLDQKAYETYQAFSAAYLSTPIEKQYKRYLDYKQELIASAAAGRITGQQARILDQEAYQAYQSTVEQQLTYQQKRDQLNAFNSALNRSLSAAEKLNAK